MDTSDVLIGSLSNSLASGFRQFLDGVAQHGAGHTLISGQREILHHLSIAFAHLPERPPHRFVNQIMIVIQLQGGDVQGVFELALPDEIGGGNDVSVTIPYR
jgi:hypothetical protein